MAQTSMIAVPHGLHVRLKEIMKRDGFASEADVIAFALRIMEEMDLRNAGFDAADLDAMADAMDALDRDPSNFRTSEQIAETIAAEYRAALKAG